jgi:hypothetical protein
MHWLCQRCRRVYWSELAFEEHQRVCTGQPADRIIDVTAQHRGKAFGITGVHIPSTIVSKESSDHE